MFTSVANINVYLLRRLYLYGLLMKFKLSLTVVFSSVMAYLFCVDKINLLSTFCLAISGFCITASANIFNQIIERELDKLMTRTQNRPLPQNHLTLMEAYLLAGILGVMGIGLLSVYFNMLSGILGALALLSYAFIYTPMKQLSPISVFIGAIPGAMPLIIGSVAATNAITPKGLIFFAIQFLWQLPHFWSIAWLLDSDYKKAGFRLLPTPDGEKSRSAAVQCIPYLLILVVISSLPYMLGYAGVISLLVGVGFSLFYLMRGFDFVIHIDDAAAKKLMFTSFAYIPIVLLGYVLDKI